MESIKKFFTDIIKSLKSKRVVTATITALFISMGEEWGISEDIVIPVAGIAIAIIVGDSIRPVNPDK